MRLDIRGDAHHHGTPARLRDGSWGVRIEATEIDGDMVSSGDTVTIETREGKEWDETVFEVVHVFPDGNVLASTEGRR